MPACLTGSQLFEPLPLEAPRLRSTGRNVLRCNHRRLEDTVRVENVTAERYR